MLRKIVTIDEDRCDGCGQCVPSCHEGAIRIVDGKARLVSDRLCDGLGACLGHCPQDAIRIETRAAEPFDEQAVEAQRAIVAPRSPACSSSAGHAGGGCPGSRFAQFEPASRPNARPPGPVADHAGEPPSALSHWPVQLRLLSPQAPALRGASLLVSADCVPVAYAGFHGRLLAGRAVMVSCPKFDDLEEAVDRLAEIIRHSGLREILVARMQVPCCMGIVSAVVEARRRAGVSVPVTEVVIGVRGEWLTERSIAVDVAHATP